MIRMLDKVDGFRNDDRPLCVTHAGVFHADEVLATAILERVFGVVEVVRVRALPPMLPERAIVYDIGGGTFDHHQRGGNGARLDGTCYASAGLIWRTYGRKALSTTPAAVFDQVFCAVDERLVEGVDAVDNGQCGPIGSPHVMTISDVIAGFNRMSQTGTGAADEMFLRGCVLMGAVLDNTIANARFEAEADQLVSLALDESDGRVLFFKQWVPWKKTLLGSTNPKSQTVVFVVFPSVRGGFNCQAVPRTAESRQVRIPFPQAWRGLTGERLQHACGVPDATFCHAGGFIVGAESRAGAETMARLALDDAC